MGRAGPKATGDPRVRALVELGGRGRLIEAVRLEHDPGCMGRSDLDRARFVGELVLYLGLVVATLVAGGAAGWILPVALR